MKNLSKDYGIQIVESLILLVIAWKIFNNSFQLTIINELIPGDNYVNVLLFLGIIKLWYYYKDNKYLTVSLTVFVLLCKFAADFYKIHSMTLLIVVLAISTYRMKFTKVCKIFIVCTFIPAFVKCIGVFRGIIEDSIDLGNTGLYRGHFRPDAELHCMGYSNHNSLALLLFGASLGMIYLFHNTKARRWVNLLVLAIHCFVFYMTDSRSTFLVVVVVLLLDEIMELINWIEKKTHSRIAKALFTIFNIGILLSPVLSLIFTIWGALNTDFIQNKMAFLGGTALGRFKLISVNMIGNNLDFGGIFDRNLCEVQYQYNWLLGGTPVAPTDNVWGSVFLCGIPYFVLFIIVFQGAVIRAFKEKNAGALLIIAGYAMMALMENIGTSNTRGLALYMPLACIEVSKISVKCGMFVNDKYRLLKIAGVLLSVFLVAFALISKTFMLSSMFAMCLFVISLYVFYIWESVEGHESTNN